MGLGALLNSGRGNSNIALGYQAGQRLSTGDNNIDIGNIGAFGDANTIRIGTAGTQTNAYIAGINGGNCSNKCSCYRRQQWASWYDNILRAFKNEIQPMNKASEVILSLKPVTFRYKKDLDPNAIPQFGLVAEQVEKVNPELVAYDDQGKPYTVRYETVNAMLLNEFLKEYRKVEEQAPTLQQHGLRLTEL